MLEQGRYSWRHDSILSQLYNFLKPLGSDSRFEVYCDLPEKMTGISTVPTDIVITNKKPDITIVNRDSKDITLIELTIPFYSNIEKAHVRKSERYEQLISDITETDFTPKLVTIEIGSTGFINKDNSDKLLAIANITKTTNRLDLKRLMNMFKKTVLTVSYCIFYSKYEKSWVSPELVKM